MWLLHEISHVGVVTGHEVQCWLADICGLYRTILLQAQVSSLHGHDVQCWQADICGLYCTVAGTGVVTAWSWCAGLASWHLWFVPYCCRHRCCHWWWCAVLASWHLWFVPYCCRHRCCHWWWCAVLASCKHLWFVLYCCRHRCRHWWWCAVLASCKHLWFVLYCCRHRCRHWWWCAVLASCKHLWFVLYCCSTGVVTGGDVQCWQAASTYGLYCTVAGTGVVTGGDVQCWQAASTYGLYCTVAGTGVITSSDVQRGQAGTCGMGSPDWNVLMVDICLQKHLWVYCPWHARVKGNDRADRLAGKATLRSGLLLRRSEVLRSLRHYLWAQSQGHHTHHRLPGGEKRGKRKR